MLKPIKQLMVIGGIAVGLLAGMDKLAAQPDPGNGGSNQPGGVNGGGNQGGGNRFQGGGPGGGFQGGGNRGGGRNFDPTQIVPMLVNGMQETFEVTDDAEWKVISERLTKVVESSLQGASGGGMNMFAMMGRQGGRNRGGNAQAGGGGGRTGALGGLFGADPEAEALQKALDAKASNAELKAAVAKVVEARKAKQAALEKARTDLRQVLSVRQEAIAYSLGVF